MSHMDREHYRRNMGTEQIWRKLLVVDDELGPRESLRFLFNKTYHVHCVESVDAAVAWLRENTADVIITDIKMPGKTGIEGLREIRQLDPDVAVIMLTGFGSLETAQEAIRHGANDYIKKPFDMHELRETVGKYAERTLALRKRASMFEDLKRLQGELGEKEHLASLGQASSELVHDLRNPLSVICGYVQLLLDDLRKRKNESVLADEAADMLDYLEIIDKNARRCQDLSRIWKDLGRPDAELNLEPCLVAEIVADVAESAAPDARRANASIDVMAGPPDCLFAAHKLHIFRALQNVVTNALQALPKQGGRIQIGWQLLDGGVSISVTDNGCGIPEGKLVDVFKPYVSTKGPSGGMGIGLFITRKVIEKHGGWIDLANRPDSGVISTIWIPCYR